MNPSNVLDPYIEFFGAFFKIVRNYGVSPRDGLRFDKKNKDKNELWEFSLNEPIYLQGWPLPKTKREIVDICVDTKFYCLKDDPKHIRSHVYVTYFNVNPIDKTAEAIKNMRFDYHPKEGGASHPIFHAHTFAAKGKNNTPCMLSKKKYKILWDKLEDKFEYIRIPIPHMCLPSVLCFLTGSHLDDAIMLKLLKETQKIRKKIPSLTISPSQMKLLANDSTVLHGFQWFERP